MTSSFEPFEERINRFTGLHPGSPRNEIVLNRLFFHVFKLAQERQNQNLSSFGLNGTTWLALIMIHATDENAIHPCDLSYAMTSSRTNITRLADELVEKGWVSRNASSEDRRRIELSLTEAGKNLVETVLPHQWQHYREVWSALDAEEIETFGRLLRKLLGRLDEITPEGDPCAG